MDLLLTPIWHNSCGASVVNKQVAYGYDDVLLAHQPRVVYDTITSQSYNLYWDLNGNLQEISNCKSENVRFHSWNEENRLRAIVGPKSAGLYGYDGNGDRVWKLVGDCDIESQNGGNIEYSVALDDAVLYPNPYLTITPQGYTKHYYLGSERIATALGEGGLKSSPDYWNQREEDLVQDFWNHFKGYEPFGEVEDHRVTNVDIADNEPDELQYGCPPFQLSYLQLIGSDMFSSCMNTYSNSTGLPESTYFTHSNHLGSASWITDVHGDPVQYIHYAPYGELLADQKPTGSTYDERYKFTGKERDAESGYDYYGARYQIVPLGIWGSPDPLLDKYIHLSPYMYCSGNPIKFVDPDGRIIVFAKGTTAAQKEQFWQAVRHLDKHHCGGRYGQLKDSSQKYIIDMNGGKGQFDGRTDPENPVIYWEPDMGYETDNGTVLSPATVLNHEFTHGTHFDDAKKRLEEGDVAAWNKYAQSTNNGTSEAYGSKEEESVITGIEQRTAQALGEVEPGQVTRTNHGGKPVPVENSISNKKIDDN